MIESISFVVYSCILKNKIDKISLTLTMFVGYQKFKTAFKKFGNFYLLNEQWNIYKKNIYGKIAYGEAMVMVSSK
jgi:hypothetical protein